MTGGHTVNGSTDSTEILEPGKSSWGTGPPFPVTIVYSAMVEDHTTSSVLVVGGRSNGIYLASIYQLKAPLTITRSTLF